MTQPALFNRFAASERNRINPDLTRGLLRHSSVVRCRSNFSPIVFARGVGCARETESLSACTAGPAATGSPPSQQTRLDTDLPRHILLHQFQRQAMPPDMIAGRLRLSRDADHMTRAVRLWQLSSPTFAVQAHFRVLRRKIPFAFNVRIAETGRKQAR
jgi:hypothetical protein